MDARFRLSVLIAAAAGCGDPITNDVFYADGAFLAALPSDDKLAPPVLLADAIPGDSVALDAARTACADLLSVGLGPLSSAAALRAATPDTREDVVRGWTAVAAAAEIDGEARTWWVAASIVQPAEGADFEWEIDVAATADGPFAPIGAGRHDPDGSGELSWDLDAFAAIVGAGATGPLSAVYDAPAQGERFTDVNAALPVSPRSWHAEGPDRLDWSAVLAVTADGLPWPGTVSAVQTSEGGRAAGSVAVDGVAIGFESCWDSTGATQWLQGDTDAIALVGVAGNCAVPEDAL